ncbi:uncharacterized protein LOC118395466 [Oncorhynchus keta]|uniref:uncharacterized protein LOC118395466 n=1 Tax=Oncorhynchus keta TaxID=8018 RepID=UPI0015F914F9|nr:uncharacterized protein LOC118395466 [Oncorhynchus keta]
MTRKNTGISPIPVTKDMVEENKAKWKEINARPIKRVAEAKARKKRRMLKKMESAKKKAEAVVSTVDIGEREKMAQLKRVIRVRSKVYGLYRVSHRHSVQPCCCSVAAHERNVRRVRLLIRRGCSVDSSVDSRDNRAWNVLQETVCVRQQLKRLCMVNPTSEVATQNLLRCSLCTCQGFHNYCASGAEQSYFEGDKGIYMFKVMTKGFHPEIM